MAAILVEYSERPSRLLRQRKDVAEFQFRYNNRKNADISGTAIKGF